MAGKAVQQQKSVISHLDATRCFLMKERVKVSTAVAGTTSLNLDVEKAFSTELDSAAMPIM
eukprot:9767416-Karenia_brevis.AAC.1